MRIFKKVCLLEGLDLLLIMIKSTLRILTNMMFVGVLIAVTAAGYHTLKKETSQASPASHPTHE